MQFVHQYFIARHYIVAAFALLLAGCDSSGNTPLVGSASPLPGAATSPSYELVTETRPEDVDRYFALVKAAYDACVVVAQSRHLPIEPFVSVPDNFVLERHTYISDGKSFYKKIARSNINSELMQPETQCKARIESSADTQIIYGGFTYDVATGGEGKQTLAAPRKFDPELYHWRKDISNYNIKKVFNGITLACLTDADLAAQLGEGQEMCIFIAANGNHPSTAQRKPIFGHTRILLADGSAGAILTEPVSAKIGGAIDPAKFAIPKY
ncbi:MAG: hypothetical protein V4660_18385 [Pseudomonadota bacterium]